MALIPNVVTHGLMALDVFNKLESSSVQTAIHNYPKSFLLGSNGPDILFYYKVFPWEDQSQNKMVADFGQKVHTEHINDFFNYALDFIQKVKDPVRKEILTSYIAGHFMHWSLDSLAHPFVFYRSDRLEGDTEFDHYRYESMIDSLMVTYYKKKNLSDLKAKRFVNVSSQERRIISSFYQTVLQDVFGIKTEAKVINSAIVSFKNILNFLYDPHNIVTPLIKKMETKPWAFSSHVVNSEIDATYDVLNLKKDAWSNPTDISDVSNQSFIEIYEESVDLGVTLVNALDDALSGTRDSFDDLIQNRQYDTGREVGLEMKFFNSIYKNK